MGLETRKSNGTYLNIMFGKLVQSVNASTEGAVERENKNGKKVYELLHDKLKGVVTDVTIDDSSDYGDQFIFTVKDGSDTFFVKFNVYSAYGRSFLMKMLNIDFDEQVAIAPYSFEDGDKTITGITFYQDGEKVENKWTKDNPGKMPELEQKKVKGKMKWNDDKRMEFLLKQFNKLEFAGEPEPEVDAVAEEDDLPF